MPKVLIAAAGGRVARRVAAALCTLGEPPRALVRNPTKARDELVDNRGTPLPQGCSTLSTKAPLEEWVETGESGSVAILAEG